MEECPLEPRIPVYLLVGGCFGLLKVLSLIWKQVRLRRYERLDDIYFGDANNREFHGEFLMSKSSRFSEAMLSLFLLFWFACGNYWVFHIYKPRFVPLLHHPSEYCDESVYKFAYIQIMAMYAFFAFVLFIASCCFICHKCNKACEENPD